MDNSVIIKGSRHGITVILDGNMEFSKLKECVRDKFTSSAKFFGNASMALGFEGRILDDDEQEQLVDIISDSSDLNIICLIDNDKEKDRIFEAAVSKALADNAFSNQNGITQQALSDQQNEITAVQTEDDKAHAAASDTDIGDGQFYKGTLRSGQVLEAETSVIVLGDVNPGGRIIAKGNVIVLGSLKGNAFAGANGNEDAFVVALEMNPMQIKIGDVIARSSDGNDKAKTKEKKKNIMPKIAFVEDGNIYIENLDADVLEDIRVN